MVRGSDVSPLLLAACPSFAAPWEGYRGEPEFDEGLPYVHLGEFARHLIGLWRAGRDQELREAFEAVERLHVEGDEYVRGAATLGLLESLQNNAEHRGVDPEVFRRYLGPASVRAWDDLNRFWLGDRPPAEL